MNPTPEQLTILDAAKGPASLVLNAFAGCGKTATLELIEAAIPTKPILYLAFNRSIAKEAEGRMSSTTSVRTFNALGHRIWAKTCARNLRLDPKKSQTILRDIIAKVPKSTVGPLWDSFWPVINGVALAKALGYVPEGKYPTAKRLITQSAFHASLDEEPDDLTSDLIDAVLTRSIIQAYDGLIDYNDQIYMPAIFGGIFSKFPLVLVDEAQDLNPTNHELVRRLVTKRLIIVGDPYQSIYGFRGAVQDGMTQLAKAHSLTPHTLSVSFRCPSAIVEAARWRVPNFNASRAGGHVEVLSSLDPATIPDSAAIICRNNAPLLSLALHLLSAGRSVSVSGSDIGPKLIALLRKLGPEELSRAQTLSAIADWEAERLDRGSSSAKDMAACMRVFASVGTDLGQAINYASHVLSQSGTLRLMTGHKAKGLEFETVYHLDPWLCRENDQDLNLRYVITTRAKENLFEIDSGAIQW